MCEHETTRIERGIIESFDLEEVRVSCKEICEICNKVVAEPTLTYKRDY